MSAPDSTPRLTLPVLALLTAFFCSCVVVIPFLPSLGSDARPYLFEIELASDAAGEAQLFYDTGRGFNESDSVRTLFAAGAEFQTLRFKLPAGNFRKFRFDPIDRPAHLQLRHAQISLISGQAVHRFSPADFTAQNQIAALTIDGETVQVVTAPAGNDPNLGLALAHPLPLAGQRPIVADILTRALPVFAVLGGLLVLLHRIPRQRQQAFDRIQRLGTYLAARPRRAIALAALAAVMVSCYPVVFLGKSFVSPNFSDGTFLLYGEFPTLPGYRDSVTEEARGSDVGAIIWQQVPYSFIQNRALLRDGELPLWNRYNSAGTVLLGQGQSMFGDPLHLPVILAGGNSWAWDLKYLFARWLLCAGLGLIVLHCTRHLPSAALMAFGAAFLGFFIYRLNHPAYFSFCYAPWILYAWIRLAGAVTHRQIAGWSGLLLFASVCELNSGTVKEAYMLLFGMHFSGCVALLMSPIAWRTRGILLAAAAWAGGLFVLLTAPTWMTLLDSLRQSYTSYDLPTAYQIHPSVALGFFDELFYRPLVVQNQVFNPSANFLVLTGVLYFVAAFARAGAAIHARAIAWSSLLPLALVFGVIPPQWIVEIPFVGNVVHIDNSFSCVLIILAIVLAGCGWSAAFARLGTPQGRSDLWRVAGLYALLVWPWVALTHTVHRPTFGPGTTFTFLTWGQQLPVAGFIWGSLAALTAATAILLLVLRRALVRRFVDASSVLLLVLACVTMLWRFGQQAHGVRPDDFVFNPAVRADFHAPSPAITALKANQTEPERAIGIGSNLFPGWTGDYNVEGLSGADALINPYYRELVTGLGIERIWDWRIYVTAIDVAAMKPALDFLNVRHYAELRSNPGLLGRELTPVIMGDLDIYRSETTWPRAFFSREISPYNKPNELGEKVRQAAGHPFAAIQNTDLRGLPSVAALPVAQAESSRIQKARDYRLTVNKTAFTVDASGPGVAVLQEAWLHRSFQATLNGQPVPYFRVNHAFKGVHIPNAGTYRVEFAYWPKRMTLALSLAGFGLILCVATVVAIPRWRAKGVGQSTV